MNNVELARTLSWRENALLEEREKNNKLKNGMRNLFCNKKMCNFAATHHIYNYGKRRKHYACYLWQVLPRN